MDQHIYNDVLESCVYGKDMRRRSMQRQIEPVDELRSKWEKDQGYPMGFAAFDEGRVMVSAGDVPVTSRGDKMRLNTGSHSVKYKELLCYDHFTKLGDGQFEGERLCRGLVFYHADDFGAYGIGASRGGDTEIFR